MFSDSRRELKKEIDCLKRRLRDKDAMIIEGDIASRRLKTLVMAKDEIIDRLHKKLCEKKSVINKQDILLVKQGKILRSVKGSQERDRVYRFLDLAKRAIIKTQQTVDKL